jgi:hypothetical protein
MTATKTKTKIYELYEMTKNGWAHCQFSVQATSIREAWAIIATLPVWPVQPTFERRGTFEKIPVGAFCLKPEGGQLDPRNEG